MHLGAKGLAEAEAHHPAGWGSMQALNSELFQAPTEQTQTHVQRFVTHNIAKFRWNCRNYSPDQKLQLYEYWNSDSIEVVRGIETSLNCVPNS